MFIRLYPDNNRLRDALKLFDEMSGRGIVIWNLIMKDCLDCGDLIRALNLFEKMPARNVVSWTTMINGFLQQGKLGVAEDMFRRMPSKDIAAWNSMINGYCSFGRYQDARELFEKMPHRDVISWTSMINGMEQQGKCDDALVHFGQMVRSGVQPSSTTFCCVLSACGNLSAFLQGVQCHAFVIKFGYVFDEFLAASFITFYAKCGEVYSSLNIFNQKLEWNVAVWTALLTGYNLNQRPGDALGVFNNMLKKSILPNQSSFCSAFNSCCSMEAVDRGREVQAVSVKLGFGRDTFVGNSLVVIYCKCGHLLDGITAFEMIMQKNIVSYNSIVMGCVRNCCSKWVLALFSRMIRAEVSPDEITLTSLLHACSSDYVMMQKGRCLFEYFANHRSIMVKAEHIACMADMYCQSGKLEEAENLIENMPIEKSSKAWLLLLGSCREYGNIEMAERAANRIFDSEPGCGAAYVLLSNLYASAGRWSDVSRIRELMSEKCVFKQPGCSGLGSTHIPRR